MFGIEQALDGVVFEAFNVSWPLQRALERGLEIISEASRSIPPELKGLAPDIPWPQIVSIGNLLLHEYQRVEALLVWNIVEEHLGALRAAIEMISKSEIVVDD